jgi:hypothetical protein
VHVLITPDDRQSSLGVARPTKFLRRSQRHWSHFRFRPKPGKTPATFPAARATMTHVSLRLTRSGFRYRCQRHVQPCARRTDCRHGGFDANAGRRPHDSSRAEFSQV